MKKKSLKDLIRKEIDSGKNLKEIEADLLSKGYSKEEVKKALADFDWKAERKKLHESGKLQKYYDNAVPGTNARLNFLSGKGRDLTASEFKGWWPPSVTVVILAYTIIVAVYILRILLRSGMVPSNALIPIAIIYVLLFAYKIHSKFTPSQV